MLGYGYGHLVAYQPFAGLLTPILAVIFGSLLGAAAAGLLRRLRVRNVWVAAAIALTVATVALYVSWATWVAPVVRSLGVDATAGGFLVHPARLWGAMVAAARTGHWQLFKLRPSGAALWLMWVAEAAIVYVAATVMTVSQLNERGFCEGCQSWTVRDAGIARVPSEEFLTTRKHLEEHDLAYLASLGDVATDATAWTELDLHACRCGELNLLDAYEVQRSGKAARPVEARRQLLSKLVVRSEEARALRALAARQMKEAVRAKAAGAGEPLAK